jgi:hypothetical protein
MDIQRGAQERYWKRTQVMSGVIFEKIDWQVGWSYKRSRNSGERLESPNLLHGGRTDWTRANKSTGDSRVVCRVNQVCEFHVRQEAFECTIWRKSY